MGQNNLRIRLVVEFRLEILAEAEGIIDADKGPVNEGQLLFMRTELTSGGQLVCGPSSPLAVPAQLSTLQTPSTS